MLEAIAEQTSWSYAVRATLSQVGVRIGLFVKQAF